MSVTVSPTQDNVFTALRSFLLSILPDGMPVVQGQVNRVAEPGAADFVVMWPLMQDRIATNTDAYVDAVFTGSIADTLLDVTAVDPIFTGTIRLGGPIFGVGVASGTVVTALGTGTGGLGNYSISPSQSVASEQLAAGTSEMMQPTEIVVQLDVHGPNSSDNSQIITTAFRDSYAVEQFAAAGFDVAPLYVDGPRQAPFLNDQQQFETRWVIDAHMQSNATVRVPLQFAAAVAVGLIEVDAVYPP